MSRYMLIMRVADPAAAEAAMAGIDFDEIIASMGRYNEELIKAGVMLAGEGLCDAESGFVVDFDADPPVVTDGPYAEAKELFNGFWIIETSSAEGIRTDPRHARARGLVRSRQIGRSLPAIL
ncbi:MAG: hypothetical protein K0R33_3455 [Mycobacterium sp.]|nr:hypothetical protein [Mycobacterium sp.]